MKVNAGTPGGGIIMVSKGEKELVDAIHEAEESEHKLEERVESLKHQDEELHAPDAISKALTSSPTTRDHMRAPHLGD
jgi:hypothetical protein